ncbi:MAG: hypothetical protein LBD91_07560 [Prevotellaceae bacterium]|nr:hypothetical protein [Prevotellaceae bacterium]
MTTMKTGFTLMIAATLLNIAGCEKERKSAACDSLNGKRRSAKFLYRCGLIVDEWNFTPPPGNSWWTGAMAPNRESIPASPTL